MFLIIFQLFGIPVHGTGNLEVGDAYEILDADKEAEREKALLTDLKAQKIADLIIGKGKNTKIFDEIDEEIREDILRESLEQKPKKIFNFGQWGWKKGF